MVALLDHTGAPIRQKRTLPQRTVRKVRATFDSAQTNRHNENHWANSDGLSAAAAHSPEVRKTLRDRARYEAANNTYCLGMVRTLANDSIGNGPTLKVLSGNSSADSQVEMEFWLWSQEAKLAEKLRCMRMARCVDGETFGLLFANLPLRHPVKLDVRLYEAEQVALPIIDLLNTDLRQSDGIIFDDFGNPAAYTLLRRHPGDETDFESLTDEYDLIPSRNMIHLFRVERPGQVRGVPEITPALPLFSQLRRYTLAVIAAAETAADIAALMQTNAPPEDTDEVEPFDVFDLERRAVMTLPRGWTATQMDAKQPTTTYQMFKREIINEIARVLNMPYNIAAGDSAGYNYASGRLDHQTYFKAVDIDRRYMAAAALEPVFERWWTEARLVGVLPAELADLRRPPLHEWHWEGHEHVDPLKEANAATALIDGCLLSETEYQAKRGRDAEEIETEVAKELGVSVTELRRLKREKRFGAQQQPAASTTREADEDE